MSYTPYSFVLFLPFPQKVPHALSLVHVKYCCCDFDCFCGMVGDGDFDENFHFFLFRTREVVVLFPVVGHWSWDQLHDRHSLAESPLVCRRRFFPAQKPLKSSLVHDHALAHLQIGDRTVDY